MREEKNELEELSAELRRVTDPRSLRRVVVLALAGLALVVGLATLSIWLIRRFPDSDLGALVFLSPLCLLAGLSFYLVIVNTYPDLHVKNIKGFKPLRVVPYTFEDGSEVDVIFLRKPRRCDRCDARMTGVVITKPRLYGTLTIILRLLAPPVFVPLLLAWILDKAAGGFPFWTCLAGGACFVCFGLIDIRERFALRYLCLICGEYRPRWGARGFPKVGRVVLKWKEPRAIRRGLDAAGRTKFPHRRLLVYSLVLSAVIFGVMVAVFLLFRWWGVAPDEGPIGEGRWFEMVIASLGMGFLILYGVAASSYLELRLFRREIRIAERGIAVPAHRGRRLTEYGDIVRAEIASHESEGRIYSVLALTKSLDRFELIGIAPTVSLDEVQRILTEQGVAVTRSG